MTRTKSTFLALLAVLLSPMAANADFIGETLTIEWHFNSLGSIIATETGPVGAGIEFVERFGGPNIDVGSTTIDFFGADGGSFTPAAFNGFVFTDTFDTIADFIGISIVSQTGYTGFDLFDINFTANRIEVNFEDAGPIGRLGDQVQLLVQFAAVPEPGTLALFGIGLLGMGAARRKKKA